MHKIKNNIRPMTRTSFTLKIIGFALCTFLAANIHSVQAQDNAFESLRAGASPHIQGKLGFAIQNLTSDLADQLGFHGETGVVVTQVRPGSIASAAGIKAGVLIKEINHKPISNPKNFKQAIEQTPEHGTVLLLVTEEKYSRYVALKLD